MRLFRGDWKWTVAVGGLVIGAAAVVLWPLPRPESVEPVVEAEEEPLPAPEMADDEFDEPDEPYRAARNFAANRNDIEGMLHYRVQEGDTVEGICRLFVIPERDFYEANRLSPGAYIRPGDVVLIPPIELFDP